MDTIFRLHRMIAFTLGLAMALPLACRPPNADLLDFDGDGVPDATDAFPTDPTETIDSDGDGVGDNADAFPNDPSRVTDPNTPAPDGDNATTDNQNTNGNENDNTSDSVVTDPPPDAFAAQPGEPIPTLPTTDAAAFAEGSTAFQKTFTTADGLDADSTGDSCTECHGASPLGAAGGLHLTRFAGAGPADSDLIELRNTPALFGVGLFERVSDAQILLGQDSLDADGDGISGRANVDGDRVGRYGRKAQAASLESIVRGMLLNQLGITSAAATEANTTAIAIQDGGTVATERSAVHPSPTQAQIAPPATDTDPGTEIEIDAASVAALIAFQANLASPLRGTIDESAARGEALFESIGCAGCHVPFLTAEDGEPVRAYSDLLLHDMGEGLADGITRGVATGREFRTQPLWGVGAAGPYLHDGRAASSEEAIEAHGGEAATAARAYADLSQSERQDLTRFLESL